ncbi:MAG: hypothetical protein E7280_00225 [Lachnospiraceae bacterium]|jgi:hypothetical protein|nr:hypothetical protein [Lachnospiraceae bacterium]
MEAKKDNKKKNDPMRDRNTFICNMVLVLLFLGLAMTQKGGFSNGRFVLDMALAAVNIVSAVIYYNRYRKKLG